MLEGSEGNYYEYQMSWLAMTGGLPAGLTRGAGKGAEDKSVRIRMCTPKISGHNSTLKKHVFHNVFYVIFGGTALCVLISRLSK